MAKCHHNEEMRLFCIKSNCQHANVGGCSQCFLSDSTHNRSQDLIDLQQLQKLMSKYSFPKSVKPQCVNLQDSFYTYFKKIQNEMKEIIVTIDQICKNVVNTIGFPYISFRNNFTVYKRIKNKQYNRISVAEFRKFVTQTKQTQVSRLSEMEEKLYLKEVNNYHEMIKEIDHMMGAFENVTKYYDQKTKFIHDTGPFLHNKAIVEKIKMQVKVANTRNQGLNGMTNSHQLERERRVVTEHDTQSKMVNSDVHNSSNQQTHESKKNTSQIPQIASSNAPQKNQNLHIPTPISQPLQKAPSRNSIFLLDQKKQKPGRRISIDHKMVNHRPKLQEKINKLKKSENSNSNNQNNFQLDNTGSQEISKEKIRNINLPAAEQRRDGRDGLGRVVSVVPVTRRLEAKFYEEDRTEQVDSPLLRKKFHSKSKNSKQQKSPTIISSPQQPPQKKPQKFPQNLQLKLQKVKESLPSLTQPQQKSSLILTASLKLPISEAIPALEKALLQSSNNLSAAQYLSFLYIESNQFGKCLRICEVYLGMLENSQDSSCDRTLLMNNKAAALNSLGRYSETVKLLSGYQYANQMSIKNLGNAYYGLGFLDQAISLYRKFTSQYFDDDIFYNLSGCLYLIGEFSEAKVAIEKALSIQPQNKDYLELESHIINSSKIFNNPVNK